MGCHKTVKKSSSRASLKCKSNLHLKHPSTGEFITSKEDIANKIGATFEKNSSSQNYTPEFKNTKKTEEEKPLNFTTRGHEKPYNRKFRLRDLKQ